MLRCCQEDALSFLTTACSPYMSRCMKHRFSHSQPPCPSLSRESLLHHAIDFPIKRMLNFTTPGPTPLVSTERFSRLSQGLEDDFLECFLGWWADAAATCCPGRPSEIALKSMTKHRDRREKTLCTDTVQAFICTQVGLPLVTLDRSAAYFPWSPSFPHASIRVQRDRLNIQISLPT